jgi:hypothetical protein
VRGTRDALLEDVLNRLNGMRPLSRGWVARCPAHEDVVASLSVATGRDGRVLFHCHAGCRTEDVLTALGLNWSDLFTLDHR